MAGSCVSSSQTSVACVPSIALRRHVLICQYVLLYACPWLTPVRYVPKTTMTTCSCAPLQSRSDDLSLSNELLHLR